MTVMYAGECHPGDQLTFTVWQDARINTKLHFDVMKDNKPVFYLQLDCTDKVTHRHYSLLNIRAFSFRIAYLMCITYFEMNLVIFDQTCWHSGQNHPIYYMQGLGLISNCAAKRKVTPL